MSKGYKFANFDTFSTSRKYESNLRQQQYAYNGRMFIPPSTEKFTLDILVMINICIYRFNTTLIIMKC